MVIEVTLAEGAHIMRQLSGETVSLGLPPNWRQGEVGMQVIRIMREVGVDQWSRASCEDKNRARRLYDYIDKGQVRLKEDVAEVTSALRQFSLLHRSDLDRDSSPDIWGLQRERAWIGDCDHRKDIRRIALQKGIPGRERDDFEIKYCSDTAQSHYWGSLSDRTALCAPLGETESALSTAFECCYTEVSFRKQYLMETFGQELAKFCFVGR